MNEIQNRSVPLREVMDCDEVMLAKIQATTEMVLDVVCDCVETGDYESLVSFVASILNVVGRGRRVIRKPQDSLH